MKSSAPKATATIIDVAQVASSGVRWNSSPGITTEYSKFSLNRVKGVEELSATNTELVMLRLWDASGSDLLRRPWPVNDKFYNKKS